ncbi:hypothetical protein C8J57DRAFT_1720624 [Mycena rebaudengoi]|nr:hypothetical protein C8J57DRAFT_1720624 [Mycena rebaudengoi]
MLYLLIGRTHYKICCNGGGTGGILYSFRMCLNLPHKGLCPICGKKLDNLISIVRCPEDSRNPCREWEAMRSLHYFPFTAFEVDFVDGTSDPDYRDLDFIVRPCGECAIRHVHAQRLIDFERSVLSGSIIGFDFEMSAFTPHLAQHSIYFTKPEYGYSKHDYPSHLLMTGNTAPIYLPAVSLAHLQLPDADFDGSPIPVTISLLSAAIWAGDVSSASTVRYDALERTEWNGKHAFGVDHDSYVSNTFLLPAQDAVPRRSYNPETQRWAHPFVGEMARLADEAQSMPYSGSELADVMCSFTVNGVVCRRLPYLFPDRFAPTPYEVDRVIAFGEELLRRIRAEAELASSLGFQPMPPVIITSNVLFRRIVYSATSVYQPPSVLQIS